MSLINDVLQQLDARVPVVQPQRITVESISNASAENIFSPAVKIAALAAFGFICGYGALAVYQTHFSVVQPVSVTEFSGEAVQLTVNTAPSGIAVDTAKNVHTELSLTGSLTPIDLILPQSPSEELLILDLAQQHFLADRLTYPPMKNAYQLYREVLLKDPNNQSALDGIVAIKQRYVTLASEAVAQADSEKVRRYIERAEFVGVDAQELNSMRAQLQQLLVNSSQLENLHAYAQQRVMPNESAALSDSRTVTQIVVPTGEDPVEASAAPDIPINTGLKTISSSEYESLRNSAQQNTYNSATVSNSGQSKKTEQVFLASLHEDSIGELSALKFIETHADSTDTVRWLAKRWVAAQAWSQLLNLMDRPSGLPAIERDVFRAQSMLGLKQYDDIISWLKNTKELQASELQRVLAVALQKTGREAQAIIIYQRLVDQHPNNSGLWLALGLCADATANASLAHMAFFRAQQLGGHTQAVNDFLNRKLNKPMQ